MEIEPAARRAQPIGIDEPDAQGARNDPLPHHPRPGHRRRPPHPYVKAEKVIVYREGQLVNPQDVADVLGKTRSIRLLDDAPAARRSPPR